MIPASQPLTPILSSRTVNTLDDTLAVHDSRLRTQHRTAKVPGPRWDSRRCRDIHLRARAGDRRRLLDNESGAGDQRLLALVGHERLWTDTDSVGDRHRTFVLLRR